MGVEKEEFRALGVMETGDMVHAAIGNASYRTTLENGKLTEIYDLGKWFDSYILQLNADLEGGKIDEQEIEIAKRHLTKVGEQLTQRSGRSSLEIRHIEGEVRGLQGLAGTISKRLELSQAKIEKSKKEAEEIEERRKANEAEREQSVILTEFAESPEGEVHASNA